MGSQVPPPSFVASSRMSSPLLCLRIIQPWSWSVNEISLTSGQSEGTDIRLSFQWRPASRVRNSRRSAPSWSAIHPICPDGKSMVQTFFKSGISTFAHVRPPSVVRTMPPVSPTPNSWAIPFRSSEKVIPRTAVSCVMICQCLPPSAVRLTSSPGISLVQYTFQHENHPCEASRNDNAGGPACCQVCGTSRQFLPASTVWTTI